MAGNQFKDYTPVVGRKESKRWVSVGASYDGDGWGDEYDDGLDTVKEESAEVEVHSEHGADSTATKAESDDATSLSSANSKSASQEAPLQYSQAAEAETKVDAKSEPKKDLRTVSEETDVPMDLPASTPASRTSSLMSSRAKRQSTVTRRPLPVDSEVKQELGLGPTSEFSTSGYADTPARDLADSQPEQETDNEQDEEEEGRPQSELYNDIYEYYGDRKSHPYSQLTRESVYYSMDSVAKSSTASPGPQEVPHSHGSEHANAVNRAGQAESEPRGTKWAGSERTDSQRAETDQTEIEHSEAETDDSEHFKAQRTVPEETPSTEPTEPTEPATDLSDDDSTDKAGYFDNPVSGDNSDELPTPEEQARLEHEIMHTFMVSDKRRSVDLDAGSNRGHSRSTSSTSRSSIIAESYDAEIAELYQGTTAFLDRPISVYQNVEPLHVHVDEDKSLKDTSDVATPKVESNPTFEDSPALPVDSLEPGIDSLTVETDSSGIPQLNFIAASPTAANGDRPRWQPISSAADISNASSSTVVAKHATAEPPEDSDNEDKSGSSHADSSLANDLSITGDIFDRVDQSFDGGTEVEKTTTRDTSASSSARHTHTDSGASALSMISDNHDVVMPDLPVLPDKDDTERSVSTANVPQFTQISAKVKRPPPVDFSALLSGPTSEARLTQLVNLRQREAEYDSGLSVWLLATYSQLEGNSEVYTTGVPPENEGRSVSMTRQMTHISSEHLSSTKEALEHFGEKSTKKARSLLAKGRRLVKS